MPAIERDVDQQNTMIKKKTDRKVTQTCTSKKICTD